MTPDITEDQLTTELRTFLVGLALTGVHPDDVILAQINRVPEPKAENFVIMTPIGRRRLATNVETWSTVPDPAPPPDTLRMQRNTEITVQIDIHGPVSADNAATIATVWRSDYGCRVINPAICQPLYATDGHQAPFVNAEKQYEFRWVMTLVMQANMAVSTQTDFADSIGVEIIGTGA